MNSRKNEIISILEDNEPPYACLINVEDHEFDNLLKTFEEICKENRFKFILLPPMFPIEKSKLRRHIEEYVNFAKEIVMLSKTGQLPHNETIMSILESNMFLFIVYTRGELRRGVWEVIR